MRDATIAKGCPTRPVGDDDRVLRAGHFDVVECRLLHQPDGVEILLKADAAQVVERQAGQRENRRPVDTSRHRDRS